MFTKKVSVNIFTSVEQIPVARRLRKLPRYILAHAETLLASLVPVYDKGMTHTRVVSNYMRRVISYYEKFIEGESDC